ncbi:MAG: tetratricopeptide repeat protein [Myxococcales bacterium]|nr:tetratricopeptide repeat protein [Myxococcales bacterium]
MEQYRILPALASLAAALCGCAPHRLAYTPDEVRGEFARRLPGRELASLTVPFEISADDAERARQLVRRTSNHAERAEILKNALFTEEGFGIRYAIGLTTGAAETLRERRGNCLSIASAFVGLARAVGLSAYYLDASDAGASTEDEDQVLVKSGHITAAVELDTGLSALDFGGRLWAYAQYRVIDDLEAAAHFFNNRGYEMIRRAIRRGEPVDWEAAIESFTLATLVKPSFARAWNNLGVAFARLHMREAAIDAYLKALALDERFASPATNLGILYQNSGEATAARRSFEEAARRDPRDGRARYHLGVAAFRNGDMRVAVRELSEAIRLDSKNSRARALLAQILRSLGKTVEAAQVESEKT